jgi:hypothetical protein
LQQHKPRHDSTTPRLLQTVQVEIGNFDCKPTEKFASYSHPELGIRWKEIYERIKISTDLGTHGQQQLWEVLERYQDVFAWNKGELGCCTIGEIVLTRKGFHLAKLLLVDCLTGRRLK